MPAKHPSYSNTLSAKLQNYELQPQHLPAIRDYASGSTWKKGSLQQHFGKHGKALGYQSAAHYHDAALKLLFNDTASLCLQYEYGTLIMYVYDDVPGSKSGSYQVLILDLDARQFKTYSRKRRKQLDGILDSKKEHITKQNIFRTTKKESMKKEKSDQKTPLHQALLEYDELSPVAMYYDAVRMLRDNDLDEILLEAYSCYDYRTDLLQVLIEAKKLSEAELYKIHEVDSYILDHEVHPLFEPLKTWLRENRLYYPF